MSHLGGLQIGIPLLDEGQGRENRSGALREGVIDHDIGKYVRSVESLDPERADDPVAASPATIAILVAQNKSSSIFDDFLGYGFRKKRLGVHQG